MIKIDKMKIEEIKEWYYSEVESFIRDEINNSKHNSKYPTVLSKIENKLDIIIKNELEDIFTLIRNELFELGKIFLFDIYEKYIHINLKSYSEKTNQKEQLDLKIEELNSKIIIFGAEKINKQKNNKKLIEIIKDRIKNLDIKDLREELKKIFNYDKISDEVRYNLITKIGVEVCPYCNRQFINKFKDEKKNTIRTTADLDHFYLKDKYPFLALSIYNFIPSCKLCNSRTMKGEKNFFIEQALYPYKDSFNDKANFTLKLSKEYDIDVLMGNSNKFSIDFKIKVDNEEKIKTLNTIKTFKLKELYMHNHNNYIRALIKKSIIYNESRINELYKEYQGTLFKTREELLENIVSNYISDENIDKEVLSKLTKDIMEELGLNYKT